MLTLPAIHETGPARLAEGKLSVLTCAHLPFEAEYFPMGYALRLSTNSLAILSEAEAIWPRFQRLSDTPAVRLTVVVTDVSGQRPLSVPSGRAYEHFYSMEVDSSNCAEADLKAGIAHACFTADLAADSAYLRYHFLEPLGYVLVAARHFTFVHSSCIALNDRAIILCGDSGAGKTCLAYACARKGWTFVSGDATAIVRAGTDYRVVGRPHEIRFRQSARRIFPELAEFAPALRPSGKKDIEIDPRQLGIASAAEAHAAVFVFLERTNSKARASIEPVSPRESLPYLVDSIRYGNAAIRAEKRLALDRFLALPFARLRYSNLEDAEDLLRSLLGEA